MKKKTKGNKSDIVFRIAGSVIFIFMVVNTLILINQGFINNTLLLITFIPSFFYGMIGIIVFLFPTLIKFFKKLKK